MIYLMLGYNHCSKLKLRLLIGEYDHMALRMLIYENLLTNWLDLVITLILIWNSLLSMDFCTR